jgi:hypothetical protein
MLKLIGAKRAMVLFVLLGINLCIAGVYLLMILPLQSDTEMQILTLDSQIGEFQGKISGIKQELANFKTNLPRYEALKASGFFSEQDRFRMARELDVLRGRSGIASFAYTIEDIKKIENLDAAVAQVDLADSRIVITGFNALVDSTIYAFVQNMQRSFPAHLRLHSFSLRRVMDVNESALETIALGKPTQLISSEAVFDWLTIVPLQQPGVNPLTGLPGGQP